MQQVEVRFKINPKKYSFLSDFDLKRGDNVIVETALGQSYGVVEEVFSQIDDTREMKKVIRKATEQDAQKHTENMEKEKYAILKAKEMAEALKLDINVVNAEYSFDGSKLLIDFIAVTAGNLAVSIPPALLVTGIFADLATTVPLNLPLDFLGVDTAFVVVDVVDVVLEFNFFTVGTANALQTKIPQIKT